MRRPNGRGTSQRTLLERKTSFEDENKTEEMEGLTFDGETVKPGIESNTADDPETTRRRKDQNNMHNSRSLFLFDLRPASKGSGPHARIEIFHTFISFL